MSESICPICRKSIAPGAKTAELGDQVFHSNCLQDGAELTVTRALADLELGRPQ
jgi:hypothetical protein